MAAAERKNSGNIAGSKQKNSARRKTQLKWFLSALLLGSTVYILYSEVWLANPLPSLFGDHGDGQSKSLWEARHIYSFPLLVVGFFAVSVPFGWGYLLLTLTSGLVYGFLPGIILVSSSATCASVFGTEVCRRLFRGWIEKKTGEVETLAALRQALKGPRAYRIVFLARLTPIPFGLQNAVFSMTDLEVLPYVCHTLVGLLPTQLVYVYIGSTLATMQEVLHASHTAHPMAYVLVAVQITAGLTLSGFVLYLAKIELRKATQQSPLEGA